MSPPRRSLRCDFERAGRLYNLVGGRSSPCPGGHAPGTDDPSAPTWLGLLGHRRELIALAVPNRPQRLDGFYDREPAAGCAANFMSGLCPTASGLATIKNSAQLLLLSTELSTERCASKTPANHGTPCFEVQIATRNPAWRLGVWITMAFEPMDGGNL